MSTGIALRLTPDSTNEEAVQVLQEVVDWASYRANNCDTPWGVYGFTHLYRTALDAIAGLTTSTKATAQELEELEGKCQVQG